MLSKNGNEVSQNPNIEELKRQILLKQALLDSTKNSRRKSTGGINNQSASQATLGLNNRGDQQQLLRSVTPGLTTNNPQFNLS